MNRAIEFLTEKGATHEQAVILCSAKWDENKQMLLRNEYKQKAAATGKIIKK